MEEENRNQNENNEMTLDSVLENKNIKSEYDRRFNALLEKKQEEWKSKWAKETEEKRAEAERLAKLTAEEKVAEREKAIKEREDALNKKELISQTKELLMKESLPTEFANSLVYTKATAEDIKKGIGELKEIFNKELEESVKKRLAGNTPQANTNSPKLKKEYTGII